MAWTSDRSGTHKFVPHTASYFEVEGAIFANGVTADIRRFGWTESNQSWLEPDVYYLSYGLTKRTLNNVVLPPGHQHYRPAGKIVFVPAGVRFRTRNSPSDIRTLCVTMEANRLVDTLGIVGLTPERQDFNIDVRDVRVEQYLTRILEEVREPGFASTLLVESLTTALMIEMFGYLRRCNLLADSNGKLSAWRLKRLKARIENDIGGALSISELAQECGISVRHLVRTFKNTEGITLFEYIAHERINLAKRRLAAGDALIKEIAGECGFGTAASFSAAFRKYTGKTPREFREEAVRFD